MVEAFRPELLVSASYRRRIPTGILNLCPISINFHPSLLPKHRGCWSGFWAIFDGDTESGATCHHMVEAFDEGKIVHVERVDVEAEDTAWSLYKKLLPMTRACAAQVLAMYYGDGLPEGEAQLGEASYHRRELPHDGIIQQDWDDAKVSRFIHGMVFPPFDGAAVIIGGKRLLVNSVEEYHRALR